MRLGIIVYFIFQSSWLRSSKIAVQFYDNETHDFFYTMWRNYKYSVSLVQN